MRFFITILTVIVCLLSSGCTDIRYDNDVSSDDRMVSAVFPKDAEPSLADTLKYKVCFFRAKADIAAPADSDFVFVSSLVNESGKWLSFDQLCSLVVIVGKSEMAAFRYRAVVIATPVSREEIDFYCSSTGGGLGVFPEGMRLTDLNISRTYKKDGTPLPMSLHNYVGFRDLDDEVLASGRITFSFKRLVGQLVFDFGRYDEAGNPIAPERTEVEYLHPDGYILSITDGVVSTMDRIYQVDMAVSNYTSLLSWDGSTAVRTETGVPDRYSYELDEYYGKVMDDTIPVVHHLMMDASLFKQNSVTIPGTLTFHPDKVGTTRFYTAYQFRTFDSDGQREEADRRFGVDFTFHYEYTLPDLKPNPDNYWFCIFTERTDGVLMLDSLALSLPRNEKTLVVVPNNYTVTTVKIVENRLIDIRKPSGEIIFGDDEVFFRD